MNSASGANDELIQSAIRALDNSHPSNPANLRFGAAVLTGNQSVYASSAFWSDTLTLALHAEQAAIAHAAAHGARDIVAIACVSTEDPQGERFCHPCGICKQLIYESSRGSQIDTLVIMANLNCNYTTETISKLCPYPWPV
jgi:cytidine deaminase